MKWLILSSLIFLLCFISCSEAPKEPQNQSASTNTILITDSQNNLVNQLNLKSGDLSPLISSGITAQPIDIMAVGNNAYVLLSGTPSALRKFDLNAGKWAGTVSFSDGTYPQQIAYDGKYFYISFQSGKMLAAVSASDFTSGATVSLSQYAQGLCYSSGSVYVCLSDGYASSPAYANSRVAILSTANLSGTISNIQTLVNPLFVTSDENGTIYIACAGNYNNDGGITKITSGAPTNIVLNKSLSSIAVSNGIIYASENNNGIDIYKSDGTFITNVINSVNIFDLIIYQNYVYALGSGKIYKININNNSLEATYSGVITGTWGGAIAIYSK